MAHARHLRVLQIVLEAAAKSSWRANLELHKDTEECVRNMLDRGSSP